MADKVLKTSRGYLALRADGTFEFKPDAESADVFTIEDRPVDTAGTEPPPPVNVDSINLRDARVAAPDCPDVRIWPIGEKLRSVTFAPRETFERGDTMVDFASRDALPAANGTQGAISYTLWLGCRIQQTWHVLPIVECIKQYVPTGRLLEPGHLRKNLLYYAKEPLRSHQPAPGEQVALFCTTGDTRRQNAQAIPNQWRTNVVLVPFQAGTFVF